MQYAELHCRTNFSFLEGASHAQELVQTAAELGYAALAVTDRNSLAGVVRAHGAAKDLNFKIIIGAEVTPIDAPSVVLWATDRASYGRLSQLITVGRRRAEKGQCRLTLSDVAEHSEGLLAGINLSGEAVEQSDPRAADQDYASQDALVRQDLDFAPPAPSPWRGGLGRGAKRVHGSSCSVPAMYPPPHPSLTLPIEGRGPERNGEGAPLRIYSSPEDRDLAALHDYRDIFGDRCYLLAELHYGVNDSQRLADLLRLSKASRVPLVAAGDVHYHVPERIALQHVLTAIRHGTTVAELGERCLPNAERHLRTLTQLHTIYHDAPAALRRTMEIADRCNFSLAELKYEYPEELAPPGETPMAYLRRLAWEKAEVCYHGSIPEKVQNLLTQELSLIEKLEYEAFFLTVYDVVDFARSKNILCQGRGSAANSAVCYVLGVTGVDPSAYQLLFERFVSQDRGEAPDIDVDFEHERREEVLQYVYEKYGRDRAGLAATVITYQARSAVRDVGKALGLSLDRIDALAKNVDARSERDLLGKRCSQSGVDPESQLGRQLVALVKELVGFPRHLSQHVGGMVISRGPLSEFVPIENAAMADRTVIQWDKDDLDEIGILKVDCLALGMLTAIRKCFKFVGDDTGRQLSIGTVPDEDKPVYEMITRADTVGVFQIESRAQMSMLPRLKPATFYDLVIEVAIVRPGPIQGNMVHPYLRRRQGLEDEEYPSEEVKHVLKRTLGVPLFQEQAMQLAMIAAGFSGGEADQLRRAMGAWRHLGTIDTYRQRLIGGMLDKGYKLEFAERLFEQIRGFGEYGFPESHAASFAKLVYVSAWLKHYYPAAFLAAMINSQPMGFYAPAQLIRDAREHGVEVRPADVNASDWDCTLERDASCSYAGKETQPTVRLGMRLIRGLPKSAALAIMASRTRPFSSVAELTTRARLGRGVVQRLAEAGALASLAANRRAALWQALDQTPRVEELPLLAGLEECDAPAPDFAPLSRQEEVYADYATSGLTLDAHPVSFFREQLDGLSVTPAARLDEWPHGKVVTVAGLVLMRQRPGTAKGITFVTLEDETGIANLIVHATVWKRYELAARRAKALIVSGRLERQGQVIHVIAQRLEDMPARIDALRHHSRDFR